MEPSEFLDLYNGWQWREKRRFEETKELYELEHELEMRRMSVLASWLTAPHLKKPRKPTDFYNPDNNKDNKKKTTQEESQQLLNELIEEMGVDI